MMLQAWAHVDDAMMQAPEPLHLMEKDDGHPIIDRHSMADQRSTYEAVKKLRRIYGE